MSYVFRRPFPSGLESLCESCALRTRPNFAFADLQGVLDTQNGLVYFSAHRESSSSLQQPL